MCLWDSEDNKNSNLYNLFIDRNHLNPNRKIFSDSFLLA